jgi:hypothetical protein
MINAEFANAEASESKFRSWSAVCAIPMVVGMMVLIAMSSIAPSPRTSYLFSRHLKGDGTGETVCSGGDQCKVECSQDTLCITSECQEACGSFSKQEACGCTGTSPPTDTPSTSPTYNPTERPTVGSAVSVCSGSPFYIELNITQVPDDYKEAFSTAVTRWESVIVGDIPNMTLSIYSKYCGQLNSKLIDDVLICGTVEYIDGKGDENSTGNIIGQAGPEFSRNSNNLTVVGGMRFDEADMADLVADGTYKDVIVSHICESSTISSIALQPLTTSLSHFRSSTKWDTW